MTLATTHSRHSNSHQWAALAHPDGAWFLNGTPCRLVGILGCGSGVWHADVWPDERPTTCQLDAAARLGLTVRICDEVTVEHALRS